MMMIHLNIFINLVKSVMSENVEKLEKLSIGEQKPEGAETPAATAEPVILGYVHYLFS